MFAPAAAVLPAPDFVALDFPFFTGAGATITFACGTGTCIGATFDSLAPMVMCIAFWFISCLVRRLVDYLLDVCLLQLVGIVWIVVGEFCCSLSSFGTPEATHFSLNYFVWRSKFHPLIMVLNEHAERVLS